jgi:hypothetical protein
MATSPNFNLIKPLIDPATPKAFTVTGYTHPDGRIDNDPRTLCPHVLGWKKNGSGNMTPANERVLCWQLGTPSQWRCYQVNKLTGILAVNTPAWTEGTDYSRHHGSVKNDLYHMPYPD